MGFMKTGSDIKNMIYIGELSMMYLGLVCAFPFPSPLELLNFQAALTTLTSSSDWPSPMVRKAPQHEPLPFQGH